MDGRITEPQEENPVAGSANGNVLGDIPTGQIYDYEARYGDVNEDISNPMESPEVHSVKDLFRLKSSENAKEYRSRNNDIMNDYVQYKTAETERYRANMRDKDAMLPSDTGDKFKLALEHALRESAEYYHAQEREILSRYSQKTVESRMDVQFNDVRSRMSQAIPDVAHNPDFGGNNIMVPSFPSDVDFSRNNVNERKSEIEQIILEEPYAKENLEEIGPPCCGPNIDMERQDQENRISGGLGPIIVPNQQDKYTAVNGELQNSQQLSPILSKEGMEDLLHW